MVHTNHIHIKMVVDFLHPLIEGTLLGIFRELAGLRSY